jgi:hypothetical protein
MKAERRHELQTNSLALWLRWRGPELWQQYGTKILLGLIFVAAIVVAVRYRLEAPTKALTQAVDKLASAREMIQELGISRSPADGQQIESLIREAMATSDQPSFQAEAHLALGDCYWALINFPKTPESATRPSLMPEQPREELFKRAQENYSLAMKDLPDKPHVVARAQLGLAAIEETRAFEIDRAAGYKEPAEKNLHWAQAREHYEAVAKSPTSPGILKDEAKQKLERLPALMKPLWIAALPPATTRSTTTKATTTTTTRSTK